MTKKIKLTNKDFKEVEVEEDKLISAEDFIKSKIYESHKPTSEELKHIKYLAKIMQDYANHQLDFWIKNISEENKNKFSANKYIKYRINLIMNSMFNEFQNKI